MPFTSALGVDALMPAGLGFRNLIINGDFSINQRGFSSSTNNDFGPDRWVKSASGGTTTHSLQSFTLGNEIANYEPTRFYRMVSSGQSASSDYCQFYQKIEGVRTNAGSLCTISFWAKADTTREISVELQQVFGTGGSPSSSVFTFVGKTTVNTSWNRYSFTILVPSISGKTIGTNNNDCLILAIWTSAGSTFASRSGSLPIQNGTFDFWGVQVEKNNVASSFEQRPIGVELNLCMRYYERSTTYYLISGMYGSSAYINVVFKVRKRTDPSISGLSGGSFDGTSVDNFGVGQSGNAWVLTSWIASAEL